VAQAEADATERQQLPALGGGVLNGKEVLMARSGAA